MKVENMNGRSGKVANQFRIYGNGIDIFQSYDSTIVECDFNTFTITVYPEWDYSKTTGKYRNQFMSLQGLFEMTDAKGFRKALEAGKTVDFRGRNWTVKAAA